jgi:hypothetical protein
MRNICACGSTLWNILSSCFVCGSRACDQCGEQFGAFNVVCSDCMKDASEVLEAIRPEFYDVLLEMQDSHAASIPNEPISLELYRLIVNCKSVAEVVKLFEQNAVRPIASSKAPAKWAGKKAA